MTKQYLSKSGLTYFYGKIKDKLVKTLPLDIDTTGTSAVGSIELSHLESGTYIVNKAIYPDLANDPDSEMYIRCVGKNSRGWLTNNDIYLTDGDVIFIQRTGTVAPSTSGGVQYYADGELITRYTANMIYFDKLKVETYSDPQTGTDITTYTWGAQGYDSSVSNQFLSHDTDGNLQWITIANGNGVSY